MPGSQGAAERSVKVGDRTPMHTPSAPAFDEVSSPQIPLIRNATKGCDANPCPWLPSYCDEARVSRGASKT